jgi:hypothetical protein
MGTDLNHFIMGLAHCAMGKKCSAEVARDLAPDVKWLYGTKYEECPILQ